MIIFKARYVFPVAADFIPDGTIAVEGARIVACGAGVPPALCRDGVPPEMQRAGETPAPQEVCNLGNVAIIPGLVNAHAHLDFSDLPEPLGQPGIALADWIRLVIEFRRQADGRERRPIELGLSESLRYGTTTLGDIAQPGWPIDQVAASPLDVTVFQELIAPTAERIAGAADLARNHLLAAQTASNWRPGLSPHAPYSVHPDLLAAVVEFSAEEKVPVAMHMAESPEELRLLRHGDGPLRNLLQQIGAWDPTTPRPGKRPLDYLQFLASAHRALLIHGNGLDDEEIAFLGRNAARMSVVYCPRTHEFFRRAAYPLEKMLAAGLTVALGTDGRGSSPDLSLLNEMRCVARRHPAIGLDRVLQMGTLSGARALGLENEVGTLEPSKRADLAIVALPDRDAADPHELLFDPAARVVACYCRGLTASGGGTTQSTNIPGAVSPRLLRH